jgi:hypothetical protein
MAITAEWLDDDCTILHQRYDGRWNWQDFYASFKHDIIPMISSVPHTVHLLADVSTSASIPAGNLFHTRNVLNQLPSNWGLAIVLGGNRFVGVLVQIFKSVNPGGLGGKMEVASTLDEVYQIAAEYLPLS